MKKKKQTKSLRDKFPHPRVQWEVEREQVTFNKPSMTEQAHADGCDLKLIMRRFVSTGELPLGNTRGEPFYGDAPDQEYDYKHVHDIMADVHSSYHQLPDHVREQFNNVQDYVDAITNPDREPELVEKGILAKSLGDILEEKEITSPADTERSDGAEGTSEASKKQPEETTSEG
jgi:hypothetical protein